MLTFMRISTAPLAIWMRQFIHAHISIRNSWTCSIGKLSIVLADQKHFASEYYKTVPKNLKSWLRCATDLRNICAHYGRLYYRIFSAIPANIEEVEEKDERSLWAAFLAVRNLYPNPQKWNEDFLPSIKALFEKYSSAIQLKHISFPEDWADNAVAKEE